MVERASDAENVNRFNGLFNNKASRTALYNNIFKNIAAHYIN